MSKLLIIFSAVLFVLASAQSPSDDIDFVLNGYFLLNFILIFSIGIFEEVGLSDPVLNFTQCIDDATAQEIFAFANTIRLQLLSKNIIQILEIPAEIENFTANIAPPVLICLEENSDVIKVALTPLISAYGLENIDPATFKEQVGLWALTHLSVIIADSTTISDDFFSHNYDQAGKDLGLLAQTIINGARNTTVIA